MQSRKIAGYLPRPLTDEELTALVASAIAETGAAGLPALSLTDPGVRRDLLKLLNGEKLSPVLVCDRKAGADIADGYHRVSLAYNVDPFSMVPLRLG